MNLCHSPGQWQRQTLSSGNRAESRLALPLLYLFTAADKDTHSFPLDVRYQDLT